MSIYHDSAELSTWHNLFGLYTRVPSLSPAWYKALRSDASPATGDARLDASIVSAWSSWPGREAL